MKKIYHTPLARTIALSTEPLLSGSTVTVYNTAADESKEVLSNHRGIFDDPWNDNQGW